MAALAADEIKSTTKENGLLEAAQLLQAAEQAYVPPQGATAPNRVQVAVNTDAKTVTVTATLPITFTSDSTGKMVIAADTYC